MTTHGMSQTRAYHYYGGREDAPITAHEYYRSFVNWYADTRDPPDGLSIDRIDNNRGYEPDNLRWATHAQQLANRRPYKKRKARRSKLADIRAYADALARAASAAGEVRGAP